MAEEKPQEKPQEKPKPVRAAGAKRAKKVVESEGVAHITATFNNTLITIADLQGNAITWGSSGKAGFKGSKKIPPLAAPRPAQHGARGGPDPRGHAGGG